MENEDIIIDEIDDALEKYLLTLNTPLKRDLAINFDYDRLWCNGFTSIIHNEFELSDKLVFDALGKLMHKISVCILKNGQCWALFRGEHSEIAYEIESTLKDMARYIVNNESAIVASDTVLCFPELEWDYKRKWLCKTPLTAVSFNIHVLIDKLDYQLKYLRGTYAKKTQSV